MSQPDPPLFGPHRPFSPLGGLLSYLVPGLGQIVQGRTSKGLLFFVCIYGMFFWGQYLGQWQNVHIVQSAAVGQKGPRGFDLLIARISFGGQFFIGVAAWPAIWQYATYSTDDKNKPIPHPVLGTFQQMPEETPYNNMLRNNNKNPEIGLMYTIIAGVLNLLVIYDACAGPAMGSEAEKKKPA